MWRAGYRVCSDVLFGFVTYGFAKGILLIVVASPGVQSGHIHTGNMDLTAGWTGFAVFLGLLFRDVASGINREG